MPTVALATYGGLLDLSPDDQLLLPELARLGLRGEPASWDAADVDWAAFDAVVIRSCWDYHHRAGEFAAWLDRLDRAGVRVWNPTATLRWNASKNYLADLTARGVAVVPTEWVPRGAADSVTDVLRRTAWDEVVVKPVVSASAHETWRIGPSPSGEDERRFASLVRERDMMVQPFVTAIEEAGELSFLFLGREFSHAVRKLPRSGDFRVQFEHGGTAETIEPDAGLVAQATAVLAAAPQPLLYARVDACEVDGRLLLMELELLEPWLFLASDARAPRRFAEAIRRVIATR